MLTPSDALTIEAPPGYLLIERESLQSNYSGIITLSPDYQRHTLGSMAIVRASSAHDYSVGERILLNANVGKKIEFGWNAERVFWLIRPSQILLRKIVEAEAESQGPSPFRGMKDRDFDLVRTEQPRDEGDPRGLR